jgi:hypothetical protein
MMGGAIVWSKRFTSEDRVRKVMLGIGNWNDSISETHAPLHNSIQADAKSSSLKFVSWSSHCIYTLLLPGGDYKQVVPESSLQDPELSFRSHQHYTFGDHNELYSWL